DKLALSGVPLEYLRFVRTESGNETEGEDNNGPWTPAAGTFDAWPESLSELKTLDPCCGSGHFLVAALLMLPPMRMELEGLSANEAVDRVLAENLHGLEIDQRCVELAAFALALTAWRFPDAGGYRVLPDLNVACCGLSVSVAKEEWKDLAKDNKQLRIALDWMYDEFKDAPVLGSLLNPAKSMAARVVKWEELQPLIERALARENSDEVFEAAVVAHGLTKSSLLMSRNYELVSTNVPYLGRSKQAKALRELSESSFDAGKADLATTFMLRCLKYSAEGGVVALVTPQSWLYLATYSEFRERVLNSSTLSMLANLGEEAWSSFGIRGPRATLFLAENSIDQIDSNTFRGIDASTMRGQEPILIEEKQVILKESQKLALIPQESQLANPDFVIRLTERENLPAMGEYAKSWQGLVTCDDNRFTREFWETKFDLNVWFRLHQPPEQTSCYAGRTTLVLWENGNGDLHNNSKAHNFPPKESLETRGVAVQRTNKMFTSLMDCEAFGDAVAPLIPSSVETLPAVWCFASSGELARQVRQIDAQVKVAVGSLLKVPFDLAHWQEVASEKYPHGLPEPYSDDPTQWLFHGHPASSTDALQVAVARLLGYQWPAELDTEMELATDAREWIDQTKQLNGFADNDGIVCIPAVGTEQPADDRLLNLLHQAYEDGRKQEQIFANKLAAADEKDPVTVDLWRRGWEPSLPDSFNAWRDSLLEEVEHTGKSLESWLRDKFFTQHCKLFHHRPFIWHIWDGLKDGFSALINYHKLDNKLLKTLIYTYLNDWLKKQKNSSEDGHEERLAAA
ncbi:BREX-1 system adenine-specific DNA-methyltransferase PglX, partial [Mariniblastus sp.]|nr:BREX-1 system adenine-specific DNA-methyltransferase PglX [Mariniblastus sp.]